MVRVIPSPHRLSFCERTIKAEQIAFLQPGALNYQRLLALLPILILLQLFSIGLRAQGTITAIEKKHKPVKVPTEEVMHIPHETRKPVSIGKIPMNLEIGDELVGKGEEVTVKMVCKAGTEILLSGGQRVRFLGSTDQACNLRQLDSQPGARMNIRASGPTNIETGEMRLGSKRTQYEIMTPGKGTSGALLLVFADEVQVQSSAFSGIVRQGEKLVADSTATATIQKITSEDLEAAAATYAGVDVSLTGIAQANELKDAFRRLARLHQGFMAEPNNPTRFENLQSEQKRLGILTTVSVTLRAGQKGDIRFTVDNDCSKPIKLALTLENLPFARLVSAVESNAPAGGQAEWQLEFDPTGMKAGLYGGEFLVTCSNCLQQRCGLPRGRVPVMLNIQLEQFNLQKPRGELKPKVSKNSLRIK